MSTGDKNGESLWYLMEQVQKLCVVRRASEMALQNSVYTGLQYDAIIDCYCAHLQ